jgi:hypothetical protein
VVAAFAYMGGRRQRSLDGCLNGMSEGAVWEDANLTMGVGKTGTNGYADPSVTAAITTHANDEGEHAKPWVERQGP